MYKKISEFKSIRSFFINDKSIIICNPEHVECIKIGDFEKVWTIEGKFYSPELIENKYLINYGFIIYNISDQNIAYSTNNLEEELSFLCYSRDRMILGKHVNEELEKVDYYILSFANNFKLEKLSNNIYGIPLLFIQTRLISRFESEIYCQKYNSSEILWQQDVGNIGRYSDWQGEHKGDVEYIYEYKDQILVLTGRTLASFEIISGKLLWKVNVDGFEPNDMAIHNNFGYLNKGVFYAVVELDKGQLLLERKLDNFKFENHEFSPLGGLPVYKDGNIWSTIYSNGVPFIAALKPESGDYEWVERIPTSEFTNKPKFLNDKMFILDTGGTLHIYEKEKK